jgi:hypothetical protein
VAENSLASISQQLLRVRKLYKRFLTMRYVHPAAEEKRLGMDRFEKFRAKGIMNAAMASGSHGVTTKVTTLEQVQ